MNPHRSQLPPGLIIQGSTTAKFTLGWLARAGLLLLLLCSWPATHLAAADTLEQQRETFIHAWKAAGRGERDALEQALNTLQGYVLQPYLEYEHYRFRRGSVSDTEMSAFLDAHENWAFTPGLERAWLRTLGERRKWDSLISHATGSSDTEVRCYLAQAQIQQGQTDGLLPKVQALWAVGKSQPKPCDPVFKWLREQNGISHGLAWVRIRLAMEAREPQLTRYLARYLADEDTVWADRWYQQDRAGYRQLKQARKWPDVEKSRDITSYGLRRLARNDPDRAWEIFLALDGRYKWADDVRGGILRELALWSAVGRSTGTVERVRQVPVDYVDDQLLEWFARFGLLTADWEVVVSAIGMMSPELKDDSRWRYWVARAQLENGGAEKAQEMLTDLALEANYYGFLAADMADLPYTICPQEPSVDDGDIQDFYKTPGIERALELRRAGIPNWARGEWKGVTRQMDSGGLRTAAAVATREDWPDMAIFALGNSGDLRWYEWRFPVTYGALVQSNASSRDLDPAWVMGLMRSESAMAEDAISSAGARGLMQVTPGTAKQLARKHAYAYSGKDQLLQAEDNVLFGTTYLRDLMNRFGENPVLTTGAYNAGPHAVERWLKDNSIEEPAIWIDTLPYFETRDYIPRVLAFSTIYDWRMQEPVQRISTRMPPIGDDGGKTALKAGRTAEVVCRTPERS